MKDFLFNPSFKEYKAPLGALCINELATLNLFINKNFNIYSLKLVVYNDDGEVFRENFGYIKSNEYYNEFRISFSLRSPYIFFYYFEFTDCFGVHYLGTSPSLDVTLYDKDVQGFQLNVYENTYEDFSWYKGKVMYQIFPDRFAKGNYEFAKKENAVYHENWNDGPLYKPVNHKILNNDFFGGNFQGIIDKIDYLKKLNVKVIYLNPIFLAPSNHRYDTSDYLTIDPTLGTEEDFKKLIDTLSDNGISVILDGVFNHTGDDSIYFNKYGNFKSLGAYQSKNSEYYSWYRFKEYPEDYDSWWGITTLPSVNQYSSFPNFITNEVIPKWMKYGIRGFRLDVVDEINTSFLTRITKAIKEKSLGNIVIGEVWEDATNKVAYDVRRTYFKGDELDSVMNYPLKDAIIDYLKNNSIYHLVYQMRKEINNYPKKNLDLLMNILSTHDTPRLMTEFTTVNYHTLSKDEIAKYTLSRSEYYVSRSKLKMASLLSFTLPGVPCIYYGDETGLTGYKDPFCRKTMPWDNLDDEIVCWYQKLGKLRDNKVYIDGIYEERIIDQNGIFAFSRIKDNEEIMTIVNNSSYDYYLPLKHGYDILDDEEIINSTIIYSQTGKVIKIK